MRPPKTRSFWWKLRRLNGEEIRTLAEAVVFVWLAAPMVRFLPFRYLCAMASRPLRQNQMTPQRREQLDDMIAWAVDRASKRSKLRSLCFERGLAAQLMLRRRGVDSTLYYGVAIGTTKPLSAHVWVMDGEIAIVGNEDAVGYSVLARFPSYPSDFGLLR